VAEALATTPASVNSALQRAHKTVDARLPELSQQATRRSIADSARRAPVADYVNAWERGHVAAVVAMLTEDAVLAMPPIPTWYRGREAVGAFLGAWPLAAGLRWRLLPLRASGQLAFGHYLWEEARQAFVPHSADLLTLQRTRVAEIT